MRPIDFLRKRLGAVTLLFVGLYSLVYALAFVRIYFVEHPYKVASSWIFENAAPGSRFVGPHWDDKVPVSLPGKNASIFVLEGRENELPVYERDIPAMIELLARKISAADYITFPTPRTPDSIPRIPEEYPNTTALLRLLWGEKLGFELVKTFKNRPSFLGITFNDDLADESFSVYDHPKVAVFKNVEKLPVAEILDRIKNVQRYEPLPTMNEMLLMDTGGWTPSKRLWSPLRIWFLEVLLIVLWISLVTWIVLGRIFRGLPDAGLGISAFFGISSLCFISWLLAVLGVVPLTQGGEWFLVLAVSLVALSIFCLRPLRRGMVLRTLGAHGLSVCFVLAVGALITYVMRASDPGFFGIGEQIDLAYLSYLSRAENPLPQDIFHPASALSPKLIDRFVLAWILKLVGARPDMAISTASMVVGALLGGALYSGFLLFTKRQRVSVIATVVALIPSAYLLHLVRDSSARAVVAAEDVELLQRSSLYSGLTKWMRSSIPGTPCVVVSCDDETLHALPAALGFPACQGALAEQGGKGSVCGEFEPEKAFHAMMEQEIGLFVMPSAQNAQGDSARKRAEQFSQRPDLFFKLFDDGQLALFTAAFSQYFPRRPLRVSS